MPRKRWIPIMAALAIVTAAAAALEPLTPTQALPAAGQPATEARDAAGDGQAACKIRPLCDTDADCNAICGTGLGRCIHNKCPIRICRCS